MGPAMPRAGGAVGGIFTACVAAVALAPAAVASPVTPSSEPARAAPAAVPPGPSTGVIGIALSGIGTPLAPPRAPTVKPYSPNCHTLFDPAFRGKCITATSPAGTVAGVVEVERGAFGGQERDLVWRRQGREWELALVHVFDNPGLPALLWRLDLRPRRPELVFVMPTDLPRFGHDLDVVEGSGRVSLYRFLGEGFADVPRPGDLVTYVPGATEAKPADGYFDQTLISYLDGAWRVVSQQYVPYKAAMTQHKAALWAPGAVPAS